MSPGPDCSCWWWWWCCFRTLRRHAHTQLHLFASLSPLPLLGSPGPLAPPPPPHTDLTQLHLQYLTPALSLLAPLPWFSPDPPTTPQKQILASRSEKRQLGSRKGNTFSVATFGEAAPDTDAGEWRVTRPPGVCECVVPVHEPAFPLFSVPPSQPRIGPALLLLRCQTLGSCLRPLHLPGCPPLPSSPAA